MINARPETAPTSNNQMTLNETFSIDKGDLAYVALRAIEEHLEQSGFKLGFGADDGIHEALWEALGYVEVDRV